jgi:hypothetical protein
MTDCIYEQKHSIRGFDSRPRLFSILNSVDHNFFNRYRFEKTKELSVTSGVRLR